MLFNIQDCEIGMSLFRKNKVSSDESRMTVEDYFKIISKENPLDFLSKHICPYLVGSQWDIIRKCALLMAVTNDRAHVRMRLHLLLYGEPGSGKTEFLSWWQQKMNGKLINSELTSKIGLVGDARGKTITPGLLSRYSGHVLLVDELDKMKPSDQNGLLQAMEEGSYTITKGKRSQQFQAEVRIMASCNNLSKIQRPLLDRFDFPIQVQRIQRVQRAEFVSDIIDSFMGKGGKEYSAVVRGYIQWARNNVTKVDVSHERLIKDAIKDYILETNSSIEGISYRSLEFSILRIAYAIALLEKSMIKQRHVLEAIKMKDWLLQNFLEE
ncbi:MAG: ATP-binding protein [Candidatus Thermoplasmatota archaeon]|nr:ATP-binding protein [Candidatus Thermoplasmatota archaeon]